MMQPTPRSDPWRNVDTIDPGPMPLSMLMVNMNYALSSGEVPYVDLGIMGIERKTDFNLQADDAFGREYRAMQQWILTSIDGSEVAAHLLAKPHWTMEDRVRWEETVSTYVDKAHSFARGLSEYRIIQGKEDLRNLNDLSADIQSKASIHTHDCQTMSIIEGTLVQWAENHYLPAVDETGGYKYAGSYYTIAGFAQEKPTAPVNNHYYIVSSATGNVIESTSQYFSGTSPYRPTNRTFEEILAGRTLRTPSGLLYTTQAVEVLYTRRFRRMGAVAHVAPCVQHI